MDYEAYVEEKETKLASLRDRILASQDLEHEVVSIPEWGGVVIEMRTPTVRKRGELISQFMSTAGQIDYVRMYPALVIATAYDPETGAPIFTNEDIPALSEKSSKAMERLGNVALRLAGMDETKDRMELGKDDSSPIPNGSSPSA